MTLKRRNPFAAAIFSLLMPGLGQVYNTQFQKGLIFYGFTLIINPFVLFLGLGTFYHLLVFVLYLCFVYVSSIIDAYYIASRTKEAKLEKYNQWYYYVLIYLLALTLNDSLVAHIRENVAEAFRASSSSMLPTIEVGEHFVIDKKYYRTHKIARGDVIVFRLNVEQDGHMVSMPYVKRVIGLPGDKIEVRKNKVYINGVEYPESYVLWDLGGKIDFLPEYIPANHLMVLGDNRDHSMDSRTYKEPFLHADKVIGKVKYIYFSNDWDRVGKKII